MIKIILTFFFLCFSVPNSLLGKKQLPPRAVTYRLSGGRMGDNLMAYMHAKWVSHHCDLPLIYFRFPFSDQFVFDDVEIKASFLGDLDYAFRVLKPGENLVKMVRQTDLPKKVLFIIPYFPESPSEISASLSSQQPFPYFRTNWEDPIFRKKLKELIAPKKAIKSFPLPKDKITVAVHIRRGGSFGSDTDSIKTQYPLKFPSDEFFLEQLRRLYELLERQSLYVYLFTDDENPAIIKAKYQEHLLDLDMEIHCREKGNRWNTNVLEDFFALTQFDCAIHGESNFAICAGILADYKVEIFPQSCVLVNDTVKIDKIVTKKLWKGIDKNREIYTELLKMHYNINLSFPKSSL